MVLLVFRSPELHQILDRFGEFVFFNITDPALDGYWQFLGRVDGAGQFFFHAPIPPEVGVGDDHFAVLPHEAVGSEFDLDLDYSGLWDLRFAIADQYRLGVVFVAGDAAHSHPPYGGYGINTSFEDARTLDWKLAARIQGWGSDSLLTSYDAERRPVFVSTASDFIEKMIVDGREFHSRHDPHRDLMDFEAAWDQRKQRAGEGVGDFDPQYEGSPVGVGGGSGPPGAVGTHVLEARPGHHLPPGGGVFDRLGPDFSLVTADGSTEGFVAAAADLEVPLQLVDGAASGYGSALVLVRPDHFVAWVGDEAGVAAAPAILGRATGQRYPRSGVGVTG